MWPPCGRPSRSAVRGLLPDHHGHDRYGVSALHLTDLEVTGTDKALAALRRFGSDGALASAEQASELLDAIRDVS
jgi:hypothetical protein